VLKFEQKQGTSRDSPCYKDAASFKQSLREQYGLSVPVIKLDISLWNEWEHATNLNDGMIVSFDIDSQKWYVELDDPNDDDEYLIVYEAVCEYSNKHHSAFNRYQLYYEVVLEGDDEILSPDGTLHSLTPTEDWTQVDDDDYNNGRPMLPIEWTGGSDKFSVKITDAEVDTLKNDSMEIRYEKVFEWGLPQYGDDDNETLFEFQAARMRNYMWKWVVEYGWMAKYYSYDNVIKADQVARFYGACLGKMLMGNR
jgi:hypothetical protein